MGRHNSTRRRHYGRRQHEVRERRRTDTWRLEDDEDYTQDASGTRNPSHDVFGFMSRRLSLEGNG